MKTPILGDEFFNRLEAVALHLDSPMRGYFGGIHKTGAYGQTIEFADYREYTLGDDIRRIDWNLYSRFEKHFLKLFIDERQMHIQIFLDCSASMGVTKEKRNFAIKTAASLGFLAVQSLDKTSFMLMREGVAYDMFGTITGKTSFFSNIGALENVDFKGECNIEKAIENANVGFNDGLTVIISDFLTENNYKKAIDYILYRHRRVLLVHVMSNEELNPFYSGRMHLLDVESGDLADQKNMKIRINRGAQKAYQQAVDEFLTDIKGFCASRGVGYIHAICDESIEKMLFEKLYKVGAIK